MNTRKNQDVTELKSSENSEDLNEIDSNIVDVIFNELDKILHNYNINTETSNIFEEILLKKMAGIDEYGDCSFNNEDGQASRIQFTIGQITNENAQKFLHFFHESGDNSAKIIYAYYKEGDNNNLIKEEHRQVHVVRRKPVVHFSIDGKFFYDNLFTKFKNQVDNLSKDELSYYQEITISSNQDIVQDNKNPEILYEKNISTTSQIYKSLHTEPVAILAKTEKQLETSLEQQFIDNLRIGGPPIKPPVFGPDIPIEEELLGELKYDENHKPYYGYSVSEIKEIEKNRRDNTDFFT